MGNNNSTTKIYKLRESIYKDIVNREFKDSIVDNGLNYQILPLIRPSPSNIQYLVISPSDAYKLDIPIQEGVVYLKFDGHKMYEQSLSTSDAIYQISKFPSSLQYVMFNGSNFHQSISTLAGGRGLPNSVSRMYIFTGMESQVKPGEIPESVVHLRTSSIDDFERPLKNIFPKGLRFLEINGLPTDLQPGDLPQSLETLILTRVHHDFISPSKIGVIPSSVTRLTLTSQTSFQFASWPVGFIPESVTHLEIDSGQPISLGVIPSSVIVLKFGTQFNHCIDDILPVGLWKLRFGRGFNSRIGRLPPKLVKLSFGFSYNQPHLVDGTTPLPQTLESLKFGVSFNQKLSKNVLPHSLKELTFGRVFDQPIEPGVLPPNLFSLVFGNLFNNPFSIPSSSKSLQYIELGESYHRSSLKHSIPLSVNTIRMGKLYSPNDSLLVSSTTDLSVEEIFQPNILFNIPQNIKFLSIGFNFNKEFVFNKDQQFPLSLIHIELKYPFYDGRRKWVYETSNWIPLFKKLFNTDHIKRISFGTKTHIQKLDDFHCLIVNESLLLG
eukprot:gene13219-16124_t